MVGFNLEDYKEWKHTYSGDPHMLPYLHQRRRQLLDEIKERERRRPINLYNRSLGAGAEL